MSIAKEFVDVDSDKLFIHEPDQGGTRVIGIENSGNGSDLNEVYLTPEQQREIVALFGKIAQSANIAAERTEALYEAFQALDLYVKDYETTDVLMVADFLLGDDR